MVLFIKMYIKSSGGIFFRMGSFLSDLKFVSVPQNKETGNFHIVRMDVNTQCILLWTLYLHHQTKTKYNMTHQGQCSR